MFRLDTLSSGYTFAISKGQFKFQLILVSFFRKTLTLLFHPSFPSTEFYVLQNSQIWKSYCGTKGKGKLFPHSAEQFLNSQHFKGNNSSSKTGQQKSSYQTELKVNKGVYSWS